MKEHYCKKCGLYPKYKHPQTGKVYQLCARCGWQALKQLWNFEESAKTDKERIDKILKINNF